MSVFLRNGKWMVDYRPIGVKGKRVRITLPETVQTRETALKIEKEIRSQSTQSGHIRTPLNPTLTDRQTSVTTQGRPGVAARTGSVAVY